MDPKASVLPTTPLRPTKLEANHRSSEFNGKHPVIVYNRVPSRWLSQFDQSRKIKRGVQRTDDVPLAARLVRRHVDLLAERRQVDLVSVVRPRTELHRALLVVERKPRDVDAARRCVKTERHPRDETVRRDDHVRRELAVDCLAGTTRAKTNIYQAR